MDGSSTSGSPVFDLGVVIILILIGGFFAASEMALITVKRHRIGQLAENGSRSARAAQRLTDDPSRFLATIQIAITFLGFLSGAVGATAFSGGLAAIIEKIPIDFIAQSAGTIAFVAVTLVIALVSIIIGELVPKTLALNFPERLALVVARPIGVIQGLLSPVVWAVSRSSALLVRLLGGTEKPQGGYLSTEELKLLVETGSEQGEIEEEEKEMIHGVIELGDKRVHEVMVPRIGIRAINVDDTLDQVLDMIVAAGHSRLPVFDESLDNIVGILYAKDLLPYLKGNGRGNGQIDIRALVRAPVYVPESKPVDDLLHEMQVAKRHIAIVVDEYGGTAGLVTMEDVVEEIVGEIQDEYDSEEPMVENVSTEDADAFRLDGRVSMDDLRDLFDLGDEDERDEDAYDTVGGFVVHRVGRIPLPGAELAFRDGVELSVEAAEPRRVARVLASRARLETRPAVEDEGPPPAAERSIDRA
ncbi:MAG: hemolysin family protein [Candidatus Limnocylindria bacterium]